MLSAEDLLAGSSVTHEVRIPSRLLPSNGEKPAESRVVLRPLTVADLQRISRAGREDETLSAALMIHQALIDPAIELKAASQLPAGVARFLVERINAASGIDAPKDALQECVQAPLAKACFILAKEFGWTPEEVSGMTVGQILLYVEMIRGGGDEG